MGPITVVREPLRGTLNLDPDTSALFVTPRQPLSLPKPPDENGVASTDTWVPYSIGVNSTGDPQTTAAGAAYEALYRAVKAAGGSVPIDATDVPVSVFNAADGSLNTDTPQIYFSAEVSPTDLPVLPIPPAKLVVFPPAK